MQPNLNDKDFKNANMRFCQSLGKRKENPEIAKKKKKRDPPPHTHIAVSAFIQSHFHIDLDTTITYKGEWDEGQQVSLEQ